MLLPLLFPIVVDMPPKIKRWGKQQSNEVTKQFNLFTETNGGEGWDPEDVTESVIKQNIKSNDVLRPYLAASLGGHSSNKDNQKAIRNYRRAASEYFVHLALGGVRRSTFLVTLVL